MRRVASAISSVKCNDIMRIVFGLVILVGNGERMLDWIFPPYVDHVAGSIKLKLMNEKKFLGMKTCWLFGGFNLPFK